MVETLLCNQFCMSALLSNASIEKYDDAAGVLHCRQAMGNDETCSALLCLIQRLLHNLQEQDKRSNIKSLITSIACYRNAQVMVTSHDTVVTYHNSLEVQTKGSDKNKKTSEKDIFVYFNFKLRQTQNGLQKYMYCDIVNGGYYRSRI